ncbi:MAG: signal peptide peptidase SppA [Sandaracinus sp.]|nr:signal peptide peptidase SppA [Sandaracinus sp.]MCB9621725.1 signal peptide peptidase SppA [Sandaracinus sp.]
MTLRRFALLLACFVPALAHAQLHREGSGPSLPAVTSSAPDGALALEANPGALAFTSGWELAYVHADRLGDATLAERGDTVAGVLPLPLRLAVAASVDWVRPTEGVEHGRFSLGVGWARDKRLGLGGALRLLASDGPLGGAATIDLGLSWRPTSFFALGLVGRDLLAPAGLIGGGRGLDATFDLAGQLRPFGRDDLVVEVGVAWDDDGRFGARALARVVVPRVGRLWGSIEGDDLGGDAQLRALVGVDLAWDTGVVGGGAMLGDGLGDGAWLAHARIGAAAHPEALPAPGVIDEIEVKGGARGLLGLLHRLDRDRVDPRVRGVLLRFRNSGLSSAHAQELREAIGALQAAERPVVCHFEAPTGAEVYACGAARAAYVDPAGYVRLYGPSLDVMLYGDALRRLGVRADFVRIGEHKSAVETYTNAHSSEPARRQRQGLVADVHARIAADLARDRGVSVEDALRWMDEGPHAPEDAVTNGLLAGTRDVGELGRDLQALAGTARRRKSAPVDDARTFGNPRRIGVVVIDGSIVDGANVDYPIVEIHQSGSDTVVAAIDALAADASVAAIVLRVDSPGGSALASDRIWRAIRRARRRKPVIASMGSVAASGGYYVASAADEIFAAPSTVTGSIGIFYGKVDFAPLAASLGVGIEHVAVGRRAGAESLYRPFTPDERRELARATRRWYRLFLSRVAEGRRMTPQEVDAIARGRVYTGDAARELRLVDRLGGFLAALDRARELADLPLDADVVYVPGRPRGLADYVTSSLGLARADGDEAAPVATSDEGGVVREAASLAATVAGTREGVPLALLPGRVELR